MKGERGRLDVYYLWVRSILGCLPSLAQCLAEESERLKRLDEARHLEREAADILARVDQAVLLESKRKRVHDERRMKEDSGYEGGGA